MSKLPFICNIGRTIFCIWNIEDVCTIYIYRKIILNTWVIYKRCLAMYSAKIPYVVSVSFCIRYCLFLKNCRSSWRTCSCCPKINFVRKWFFFIVWFSISCSPSICNCKSSIWIFIKITTRCNNPSWSCILVNKNTLNIITYFSSTWNIVKWRVRIYSSTCNGPKKIVITICSRTISSSSIFNSNTYRRF